MFFFLSFFPAALTPTHALQSDAVLDDLAPTKRLHDLGIAATSMESPGFNYLHRYRTGSHFLDVAVRERDAKDTTAAGWKTHL